MSTDTIDRTPVSGSSAVASYAYSAESGELTIERPNGVLYVYSPVTRGQFEDFRSASSKGRYIAELTRSGCTCRRQHVDHGEQ